MNVLGEGKVDLIDYMGTDLTVVNSALLSLSTSALLLCPPPFQVTWTGEIWCGCCKLRIGKHESDRKGNEMVALRSFAIFIYWEKKTGKKSRGSHLWIIDEMDVISI